MEKMEEMNCIECAKQANKPKAKKLYAVQSATRFSPRLFLQAYSGEQAKLLAGKVLSGEYWVHAREEQEIPLYAHYVTDKGKLRQKME